MSSFGLLLRNSIGGLLFSDENPTYVEVVCEVYSHTSQGSNTQLWNVSDNRAWGNDSDFGTLWNQTKTKTLLFNTPIVNGYFPLVAVRYADIPYGCASSYAWNTIGAFVDNYIFSVDEVPLANTRRYYTTAGLSILSLEKVRDYFDVYNRSEWKLTYVSNTQLTALRVFIPFSSEYVDTTQTFGVEIKDSLSNVMFSTRTKSPFTGKILQPKQFVTGQLGTPVISNDIRWAEPKYSDFATGIGTTDWVIVSTNSYGVVVSTVAVSEQHLEENVFGGDLYKRVNYAGALGYYRVGVARCGANGLKLSPLFHQISSYGGYKTGSASLGGLLIGMSDISGTFNVGVIQPNYTMDDASNTIIVISN